MPRRIIAQAVLLSTLVIGGIGALHSGAATAQRQLAPRSFASLHATKSYRDPAFGYSLKYPSTWKLQAHLKSADSIGTLEAKIAPTVTIMAAPNADAIVAILVKRGATSTATIKKTEKTLLYDGVTPVGSLRYSMKSVNGVRYPFSEMIAKDKSGAQADEFVLATAHGKYTYYFLGAVLQKKPTTNTRTKEIVGVINSISLK